MTGSWSPIRVAAMLGIAVIAAACGVPMDDEARRIADADVPYQLTATTPPPTAPATTSTTTTSTTTTTSLPPTTPAPPGAVLLYYVVEDRLRGVPVGVAGRPDAAGVMALLVAGPPSNVEARSVVRPDEILDAGPDAVPGIVRVDVSSSILQLPSSEQVLAIGQIVLTLSDRPGVTGVSFTSEGRPVSVARSDGSIIDGPAKRSDLIDLIG
jgi:spore germination protein GerM